MQPPFQVTFENGLTAKGISITENSEILPSLHQLGLTTSHPTLVIVGGANGMATDDLEKLRSLFQDVLCPFVDILNFAVIDGGTDAGVMQLMGQAREAMGGQFPLIGVVVQKKALLPESLPDTPDAALLEPYHTHFILVPGDEWGEESDWIANVAAVLSGEEPSMTLLINGGAIALNQDVPNSLEHARPVLIIAGSGRAADRLANAIRGKTLDPELQTLVDSGLLYTVDLALEKDLLNAALHKLFQATHPA